MWFNPLMTWLLKSPFHRWISKSIMLVEYTGVKSGRNYQTPINYIEVNGVLWAVSFKQRTWWRNLRAGKKVTLWLAGSRVGAVANVVEDRAGVASALGEYLAKTPSLARYMHVRNDELGKYLVEDLIKAASDRVMVSFQAE